MTRKQAFRLQLKIDDFVSLGVVEFIRCLPDAYFDYMDTELPDLLDNEDQTFEVLALIIHQQWSTLLEIEAKTLDVTPLALLYIEYYTPKEPVSNVASAPFNVLVAPLITT